MLHKTCEIVDVVGDTVIVRDRTLTELLGMVGPIFPIVLDGVSGHIEGALDDGPRFVPRTSANHVVMLTKRLEEVEREAENIRRILGDAARANSRFVPS